MVKVLNFFKLLEVLKGPDAALILYALLDRVPIIVYGDDAARVDDFVIDLSNLIHFRKEFIFYTDFISMSEYDSLVMDEMSIIILRELTYDALQALRLRL